MARLIFGMNQSLDGFVDHMGFMPSPILFRHFIEEVKGQSGMIYGRQMYEIMRYWDEDQPGWEADEYAFAEAWRKKPKWVVSRTLDATGPNSTLIKGNIGEAINRVKTELTGEIEVAGPNLAQSLVEFGLIDEYRIYLHPVVHGQGKSFFAGVPPKLRLETFERIDEDVVRLSYVPA